MGHLRKWISPITGVTRLTSSFSCIVTPWMKNGNILNYVQANPRVDKRTLVSLCPQKICNKLA